MLKKIGSTFIPIKNSNLSQGGSFRGATGPIGPTGPTGDTGPKGNTGNTGDGVFYLQAINSDGITVYLTNGTSIELFGISGNSPTSTESFNLLKDKLNIANAGATTNNTFLFIGALGQQGFTTSYASFKISGNGISAYYSGDDIVFLGITTNYGIGISGSVLGSYGNTANAVLDSTNKQLFSYKETTIGSTTENIAFATLNAFFQAKNSTGITNVNLTEITGLTYVVKNPWNISTNTFYIKGNTWTSQQHYHSSFSNITGPEQTTNPQIFTNNTFNISNTTNYGFRKIGSCCYCNASGLKTCIDYTTEKYCVETIDGIFSTDPCVTRRNLIGSFPCDDYGSCCVNGKCRNTSREICSRFVGSVFSVNTLCADAQNACNP